MRVNCGAGQNVNMAEFHVDYTSYIFCDSKRLDKEAALLDFHFTFYNERVDRVHFPVDYRINAVYTELCEVIVSGNNLYPSLKKKRENI